MTKTNGVESEIAKVRDLTCATEERVKGMVFVETEGAYERDSIR